jgi:hypothetical protein
MIGSVRLARCVDEQPKAVGVFWRKRVGFEVGKGRPFGHSGKLDRDCSTSCLVSTGSRANPPSCSTVTTRSRPSRAWGAWRVGPAEAEDHAVGTIRGFLDSEGYEQGLRGRLTMV